VNSVTIRNKGFIAEKGFISHVLQNKVIQLKKLDNSVKEFAVQDQPIIAGSGNSEKWDVVVNSACRLQVKSTTGNSATVVNMVPIRNLQKLTKHSLLDVQPLIDVMSKVDKVSKLSELADKEDWRDILHFFLFEGSATKTAKSWEQATALVIAGKDGYLLVEKAEAIDYLWENLTVEIRHRPKSKNPTERFLHVRVSK